MDSTAILRPVTVHRVRILAPEYGAYALTKYKLGTRKTGRLYWQAVRNVSISTNKQRLQRRCYRYNKREGVPTFTGVVNGGRLSGVQFYMLHLLRFLDNGKITYREGHYVIS